MGSDDLDDLLRGRARELLEILGRRQMACLAVVLALRLVGDPLEQGGTCTGPARGSAWTETISLRIKAVTTGSSSTSPSPDNAASPGLVKLLPSTDASWRTRRSTNVSPFKRAAMSACSVSGISRASIGPLSRCFSCSRVNGPGRAACGPSRRRRAERLRRGRESGCGDPDRGRGRARRTPTPGGLADAGDPTTETRCA
jgi:hypothetical protein